MIRVVVFDIGGVLEIVDDDAWQDAWAERWEARTGRTLASAPRRTDRSEQGLRDWLLTALDLGASNLDLMMTDFWDSYCGCLDIEMRDFVRELSSTHRVIALTNSADGARREEQNRYDFDGLFEFLVYSHEEGLEKPDPRLYRRVQQRLAVGPDQILFIDDRQSAVDGALAVGWTALRHESTAATIAAVRGLTEELAR